MRHVLTGFVTGVAIAALVLVASLAHAETCVVIPRTNTGTQTVEILIAPTALSVAAIACHCDGDCISPIASFDLTDRAGNPILLDSALTCSTGVGDSTWVAVQSGDADRNLITGEGLELSVNNSPASEDRVTVCVRFD